MSVVVLGAFGGVGGVGVVLRGVCCRFRGDGSRVPRAASISMWILCVVVVRGICDGGGMDVVMYEAGMRPLC